MSWVKLDDQFYSHPKARAAGKDGRALYIAGLCWTKRYLTDGVIPKASGPVLFAEAEVRSTTAAVLVAARLWHDEGDHWRVHDFHQHQESADNEKERKAAHAERMRKWREARRNSVTRDEGRDASRDGPVTLPDTDTYTDTRSDIEIPPTTKVVAADTAGGYPQNDLDTHRRRKRLIERAADQQTDAAKAAQNPKAYRAAIVKRLGALWDSWPPELVATLGDSDLLIGLVAQEERPRNRRPPGAGVCAICGGSGIYRWGGQDYTQQRCPNGCEPRGATA